ncbi:POK19 protein, partial [Leiothrix lutea]|nr:POK19 protein [Leiothrix lutea]
APIPLVGQPNIFLWPKLSHQHFHQNVPDVVCQFYLRWDQPKAIVATCPKCQQTNMPLLGSGVNPRGLGSCEVWQMDIT